MAIVVSKSQQSGEAKQAKPAEIKITACFVRLITGRVRIIYFTVRAATAGRLRIGGGARHRLSDRLRTGTAPGLPGHVDGNRNESYNEEQRRERTTHNKPPVCLRIHTGGFCKMETLKLSYWRVRVRFEIV